MASIKDLRKRIVSVKNTQQTTKAMKMVSAAKLRRAQEAIQNQRPYAKKMSDLIRLVSGLSAGGDAGAFGPRETEGKPRAMLVLITSDRGLCGGFNANILKMAQRWIVANDEKYSSIELSFVGRKGHDFFKSKNVKVGTYFAEAGGKVSFAKAKKVADALVASFTSAHVDEIWVIYNEFKNAMTQKTTAECFLPLAAPSTQDVASSASEVTGLVYLAKPSPQALLKALIGKNFGIQVFRVLLESQAGEHGARMSAMENATKNASEMIRKLTLQYNKQRQAGITKELLEIISGSESQKG